ncbi:hypothetical protein ACP4OV_021319 [Aristida adscensionis]
MLMYINRPKRMLALLETPSGFALFYVSTRLFDKPHTIWAYFTSMQPSVANVEEFIKVDDKSAARHLCGSPGNDLAKLIQRHIDGRTEFVVDGEELKYILETRLGVQCFYDEFAVGELMWGIKNVLRHHLSEESEKITVEYLCPLCQGIQDLMKKFQIEVPIEESVWKPGRDLREICEKLIPGVSAHIEDHLLYAEAIAKILATSFAPAWAFAEKFSPEVVLMLEAAEAAAQGEHGVRKKIGRAWHRALYGSLEDIRRLHGKTQIKLARVKLASDRCSKAQNMQTAAKRSPQLVLEASEGTSHDEGLVDASSRVIKTGRIDCGGGGGRG